MKMFAFVFCVIVGSLVGLVFLNWPTFMFLIPFFVIVTFIVWNGLNYSREMEEFTDQFNNEQEFDIVEKDGLTYVTPRSK